MRIRNTFKRGNKIIPQKDIILNHCYRLGLSNDDKTHQLYYQGDMIESSNWEDEVDESKKLCVYTSFEKYLEKILFTPCQFDEIFLKFYGEMQVGYKVFNYDLIIFGHSEDEFLMLIFCKQSRRSKTIFGAFKAKQMYRAIIPANQRWRLIYRY